MNNPEARYRYHAERFSTPYLTEPKKTDDPRRLALAALEQARRPGFLALVIVDTHNGRETAAVPEEEGPEIALYHRTHPEDRFESATSGYQMLSEMNSLAKATESDLDLWHIYRERLRTPMRRWLAEIARRDRQANTLGRRLARAMSEEGPTPVRYHPIHDGYDTEIRRVRRVARALTPARLRAELMPFRPLV